MTGILAIRDRVQVAAGLPAVLDATYAAFEAMLSVIQEHQEPASPMFVPFTMAATHAAGGRDAILFAPSLTPRPLQSVLALTVGERQEVRAAASALVGLCELVESKLTQEGGRAAGQQDQSACLDAAAQARALRNYLSGLAD